MLLLFSLIKNKNFIKNFIKKKQNKQQQQEESSQFYKKQKQISA